MNLVIFGVAILAICLLLGVFFGDLLGLMLGIDANIGGVGIAMLILVLLIDYLKKRNKLSLPAQDGLSFWGAMYIPIVVAMSANQNVVSAVSGGPLAIIAGLVAVGISWAVVPAIARIGRKEGGELDV